MACCDDVAVHGLRLAMLVDSTKDFVALSTQCPSSLNDIVRFMISLVQNPGATQN